MNKILIIFKDRTALHKFVQYSSFGLKNNIRLQDYSENGSYLIYKVEDFDAKRINKYYFDMIVQAFDLASDKEDGS